MMYSAPERTANARLDGGGTVALSLALPSVHDALTRRFRDVCKGEPPPQCQTTAECSKNRFARSLPVGFVMMGNTLPTRQKALRLAAVRQGALAVGLLVTSSA